MKAKLVSHLNGALVLMALAHLFLELSNNYLPIIYPLLIGRMGLTYTQIGFIALVSGAFASLTQPLFGYLSDRWGAGRLAVLSIGWIGLVMGLVGFAPNYLLLILLVGLGALGSAAFHPGGAALALISGASRRGAAMSLFSVGGNLGSALSPLLIALVIGWWGMSGTWVLIPIGLLFSSYLYRQLGSLNTVEANQSARAEASAQRGYQQLARGTLLGITFIIIVVMCRSWFQLSLMTYLPEWIQSQGGSLSAGGRILSMFMVSVSLGSLTGGTVSDYLGRWQVVLLSMVLLGPAHWLFLTASEPFRLTAVGIMGVSIGATFPVTLVMAQDAWPQRVGLASSLVMGIGWAPGGFGASVTGFLADQFSLRVGLQTLILAPLLGAVATLVYAVVYHQHLSQPIPDPVVEIE